MISCGQRRPSEKVRSEQDLKAARVRAMQRQRDEQYVQRPWGVITGQGGQCRGAEVRG